MGKLVNLRELSEIVGRSERVLIEYAEEGLPCRERGGDGKPSAYDTAEVVAWMIGQATARRDATVEVERRRLIAAQATRAELELARRRGDLVDLAEFRAGAIRAGREITDALLGIAPRISRVIDPQDPDRAHGLLDTELRRCIASIATHLEQLAGSTPGHTGSQNTDMRVGTVGRSDGPGDADRGAGRIHPRAEATPEALNRER